MERTVPWNDQIDVILSHDSSSSDGDVEVNNAVDSLQLSKIATFGQPAKEVTPEGLLTIRAKMYQDYMKQIPIPQHRGSVIPFTTWVGLGKSVKQLYGQPLHYLTNILLKQWDRLRIGSVDERVPLDINFHPSKAEATIWLVEEIHRRSSSHHEIVKLWLSDPMHHSDVDSIFPQL